MTSTANFLVLLYVFFSFSFYDIVALKTCNSILSVGKSTLTVAVFLAGEKAIDCLLSTEFPCEMIKSAVILLVPEYCKKASTGNLFLWKAYLLTFS